MQISTEEARNKAVAQWNSRLSKFRKYWIPFIIISFHICIMNIFFIDILKHFKSFGQPYTHGDHVPNGCPRKFHRVFSDIKFYVYQAIVVSCAGVMCLYRPGFSVKTNEDHRKLHIVKFVSKIPNKYLHISGSLNNSCCLNEFWVLAIYFEQVIILIDLFCNKTSFCKLVGYVPPQTCIPYI